MANPVAKARPQTSATGISANSLRPAHAGFTLIEILVVLVIIGIVIAGVTLSVNAGGGDRELDKERDRILALTDYLRDQAALQNREYGIRVFIGGYEFLVFNARTGLWEQLTNDSLTRTRKLPKGMNLTLFVEGRGIVLPAAQAKPEELSPQIMLYSSGELNLFELNLRRTGGTGVHIAPARDSDRIEAVALPAQPA
jgi:general secretion pathway protein H